MPCYTIRYSSVEFKAKYIDLLEEAAKRLGYNFRQIDGKVYLSNGYENIVIDLINESASVRANQGNEGKLNTLKQMYSQVGLEAIAKKKKFVLSMKKDQKFELRRY